MLFSLPVAPLIHLKLIRDPLLKEFLPVNPAWFINHCAFWCSLWRCRQAPSAHSVCTCINSTGRGDWCTFHLYTHKTERSDCHAPCGLPTCVNVPLWNHNSFPLQYPSLAGKARDSLPSILPWWIRMQIHMHSPGSRTEDKLWWRDIFHAVLEWRIIFLRYNGSPSLNFWSVNGWLELGLLQLCSNTVWGVPLPSPWSHVTTKKGSKSGFLHILTGMGDITPVRSKHLLSLKEKWVTQDWIFSPQSQSHPFAILSQNRLTTKILLSVRGVSAQHQQPQGRLGK